MQKISVPRYGSAVLGLPESGHCLTLTNSERVDATCARRWWFRYAEGLRSRETTPLRRGNAWDAFVEDLHEWWKDYDLPYPMGGERGCGWCNGTGTVLVSAGPLFPSARNTPCARCDGTGKGPLARTAKAWRDFSHAHPDALPKEEVEKELQRVSRAIEGYFCTYGRGPYETLRVVATQFAAARPICNPETERPYRGLAFLVETTDGRRRLARTAEVSGKLALPAGGKVLEVEWPWYQVAKFDALLRNRTDGIHYVYETKYKADPKRAIADLGNDPQTAGYCWILEDILRQGLLPGLAPVAETDLDRAVAGYCYDIASSTLHRDPETLKKTGKLSLAKRNTPSWRYLAAVMSKGLPVAEYQAHILGLTSRVDPKLYVREWSPVGRDSRLRYGEEIFAVAVRIAAMWRDAARAETITDLNVAFPRTTICRLPGGTCPYRAPCFADGEDVRRLYEVDPGTSWGDDEQDDIADDTDGEEVGW